MEHHQSPPFCCSTCPPFESGSPPTTTRTTLATDDPDVRVYIGSGVLVNRFAIYTVLEAEVVEAFWLTIDLHRGDNPE